MTEREVMYERVGREPMTDAELERAIESWRAANPSLAGDPLQAWGAERRMRRLNDEARERSADETMARASGTTVWAIREARAARVARQAAARDHDLRAIAHEATGASADERRGPGRPRWTRAQYLTHLREAQAAIQPGESIAERFRQLDGTLGMDEGAFRRLRRRFE